MGEEDSKKLFMVSEGKDDNTYYIIYEATVTAKLLAEAIVQEVPELAQYHE